MVHYEEDCNSQDALYCKYISSLSVIHELNYFLTSMRIGFNKINVLVKKTSQPEGKSVSFKYSIFPKQEIIPTLSCKLLFANNNNMHFIP